MDDSFLEKAAQRDKSRREYINKKLESINGTVSKKRTVLSDAPLNTDSGYDPAEDSPKRQRRSLENPLEGGKENVGEAFVPYTSAAGRGLSALKKDTSSGVDSMDSEPISEVNNRKTYVFSTNSSDLCLARKSRLANLASNINQWEYAPPKPTLPTNPAAPTSASTKTPVGPLSSSSLSAKQTLVFSKDDSVSAATSTVSRTAPSVKQTNVSGGLARQTKLGVWDQAVKVALETEEAPKPVQTFNSLKEIKSPVKESKYKEVNVDESTDTRKGVHTNVKALLKPSVDLNKSFDPAELPLSARRAMFENALLGGAAIGKGPSIEPKMSVAQRAAMFENASKNNTKPMPKSFGVAPSSPAKPVSLAPVQRSPAKNEYSSPQKMKMTSRELSQESPSKKMMPPPAETHVSPAKAVSFHTQLVQQQLVEKATHSWQQKDSIIKVTEERKQEISSLVNHWEKLSSSSSVGGNSNSEEELPAQELVEPVQKPLAHETYESDEELADCESEYESEYNERVSESELSQRAEDSMTSDPEDAPVFSPKKFSLEAGLSNFDVDTDSVAATDDENGSQGSLYWQNKESRSDTTFSPKSSISEETSYSVSKSQSCTSASSAGSLGTELASDGGSGSQSDAPLQYTVSFYRKQRQETRTPPLQTIVRREQVQSTSDDENRGQIIQDRIKLLQEEIMRQGTVIRQTSQALNLCQATAEFSGSLEQVEGERLLLIATQKLQACTNEIQRLKVHGAQGENVADGTGTLTITDLQLPLKREFIAAQLEGKINDAVHCFLCLIRHGAQVIVTQMVSTDDKIADGALCFTNHIKLQNLPPNFSVAFEVYALQTKKENLPHDKKYHIKREHSKMRLTPKGRKAESKLLLPAISSPGGPSAVRSPSFQVIGFARFSLQNCNKKCFTLSNVPFTSPLDGVLKVKLQLHAEHKVKERGFLTMFEDISGFGAWQRRWCLLNAHHLAYWKYPDDEYKKEPIGVLNLKQCITGEVKQVAWDVCARPNTFELVVVRPQAEGDRNTLITKSVNSLTTTKHLLSADTREERVLWCNRLNEALATVRKWDPQALRPVKTKEDL